MSLYNFIDTTTGGVPPSSLPAEAVSINGSWLDNEIPGFQTLSVSGRESLTVEIDSVARKGINGDIYRRRRYEPRYITVHYKLTASDAESFQSAYNTLKSFLDVEEAQFIFNDETDKYFTGTPKSLGEVSAGLLSVLGEIEIYCADPFKYDVTEVEVTPTDGVITVNYDGTAESFPIFEADMNSDMGFVAFVDGDENALQFGDPEEADGDDNPLSELLIRDIFREEMPSGWVANAATTMNAYKQLGTVTRNAYGLTAASYGTDSSDWHGAAVTKQIPADSNGHAGATDFSVSCKVNMLTSSADRMGEIMLIVSGTIDGEKKSIAEIHGYKPSTSNYAARLYCCINGENVARKDTTTSKYSADNLDGGVVWSIEKYGSTFRFTTWGKGSYAFTIEGAEEWEATEVSLFFLQKKAIKVCDELRVKWLKFTKHSVDNWDDVPNKFSTDDELLIDCKDGTVTVNDAEAYGLGALGNNWEEFSLKPGINTILCMYSDWATEPTFKMRYRKAYL